MIALIAGTRPNFMKIAPVRRALTGLGVPVRLVHTGQHFDASMSDVFLRDLGIPEPDVRFSAGGGSHAEQTATVLVAVERELSANRPDVVVVVGDVTSTLAAALAAAKLGIAVAHVEAGLRSRDWTMPEEINRVLTDRISDLLLVPSLDAAQNLHAEGIEPERVVFAGNVMVDSLHWARARPTDVVQRLGLSPGAYAVATLHRPANVDTHEALRAALDALSAIGATLPVVFPVHPRTAQRARELALDSRFRGSDHLLPVDPMGYFDFVTLVASAKVVATDSGGLQEETTALGVPCLTLRNGTERPITVTQGTNTVVGVDLAAIQSAIGEIMAGRGKRGTHPEGWDGHAGERCAQAIVDLCHGRPPPRTAGPRA